VGVVEASPMTDECEVIMGLLTLAIVYILGRWVADE
jgi:hypothetical protein